MFLLSARHGINAAELVTAERSRQRCRFTFSTGQTHDIPEKMDADELWQQLARDNRFIVTSGTAVRLAAVKRAWQSGDRVRASIGSVTVDFRPEDAISAWRQFRLGVDGTLPVKGIEQRVEEIHAAELRREPETEEAEGVLSEMASATVAVPETDDDAGSPSEAEVAAISRPIPARKKGAK